MIPSPTDTAPKGDGECPRGAVYLCPASCRFLAFHHTVDHELAGVRGIVPSRLSLDVGQRNVEQSHLRLARSGRDRHVARLSCDAIKPPDDGASSRT
jgi:hypothetical protein